jgi:sugar phosphate isomerase/epimerase
MLWNKQNMPNTKAIKQMDIEKIKETIMEIIAKSKFNNNIYDKMLKGAAAIELHLEEDFIDNPVPWDEQIVSNVPIVAVHTPLIQGSDTNIEIFDNRKTLVKTCDFARKIADAQGHTVLVVCHLGTSTEILKELGLYESLVFFMRDLANSYEKLEFAVENVTPFDNQTSELNGHVGFRSVQFDSSVKFVKDVNHLRVGTCLDTCHALMTIALMNELSDYLCLSHDQLDDVMRRGIEAFFDANKDTVKWMHLANSQSHGLHKNHGLPFIHEDTETLQNILHLYRKYEYECPIVIEVREEDYSNAKNYATTYRTLNKVLQNLE